VRTGTQARPDAQARQVPLLRQQNRVQVANGTNKNPGTMKCILYTEQPYEEIWQLFKTELERQHARSSITLTDEDGMAVFTINAEDIAALRAATNSITSILGVHAHGKRFSAEDPSA